MALLDDLVPTPVRPAVITDGVCTDRDIEHGAYTVYGQFVSCDNCGGYYHLEPRDYALNGAYSAVEVFNAIHNK